jgi:gluconolactonase
MNPSHLDSRAAALAAFCRSSLAALALLSVAWPLAADESPAIESVATGLQFPEGTIFVGNTLYFVDYATSKVLRLGRDGGVQTVWQQAGCGANGLVQTSTGLLVACYDSGVVSEITLDGHLLATIAADDSGRPFLHPNDLAADARGGVYFSASGSESVPGKVYYRDAGHRVREVASNIRYANGVAVSNDGERLYLAESAANRILVYRIGLDASLVDGRELVRLGDILSTPGQPVFTPDGVRIDRKGRLFIGLYRGGGFAVIDSDGRLISHVDLPGSHHANLALSPDGRYVFATASDDVPGGTNRGAVLKVANPTVE